MKMVNIYRNAQQWAYALWVDGEFDSSDGLEADTESEARDEAMRMFPGAEVQRVADTNE